MFMCKKSCYCFILISVSLLFISPSYGADNQVDGLVESDEFTLTAVHFNKVGLINSFEFYPFYEDYLGARIKAEKLKGICVNIIRLYGERGFSSVGCSVLPAYSSGVVNIHVMEGEVGSVRLTGDTDENDSLIKSYVENIAVDQPIETAQVIHVERMLNAIPGIRATSYIAPMPDSQKLELIFDIKTTRYLGEFYINNRGSKVIGQVQAGLLVGANSLLGKHEYLGLHLFATEDTEELKYIELDSAWPVGDRGSKVLFKTSYADSKPGDLLESLNINVDASAASLGWSKPVFLKNNDSLLLTSRLDYFKSETRFSGNRVALDELYKIQLSLDYVTSNIKRYTQTNITVIHGLSDLNTTTIDDGTNGLEATGNEDFSAVKFDIYYNVVLLRNVQLSLQTQGQYAFTDLPVSEYIAFGGEVIGSAYDPAEFFGDHGLGGKSRLNYLLDNSLVSSGYTQLYAQYDIVKTWNNSVNLIQSGASVAAGMTIESSSFHLDLQVAKPLTQSVLVEGNKDVRFFASLRTFF